VRASASACGARLPYRAASTGACGRSLRAVCWRRQQPRVAQVSSFGTCGVNMSYFILGILSLDLLLFRMCNGFRRNFDVILAWAVLTDGYPTAPYPLALLISITSAMEGSGLCKAGVNMTSTSGE
jgi:hypothetical protein